MVAWTTSSTSKPPVDVNSSGDESILSSSSSPGVMSLMSIEDNYEPPVDYRQQGVVEIIQARASWLALFAVGLAGAAYIMHRFEDTLESRVQLAFFVPLIMGHGGNSGSQTVSSIIRALALRQVKWRTAGPAVAKEAAAGAIMGAMLGLPVLALSFVWSEHISVDVGMTVAIALPLVSAWANAVAAYLTLASHKLRLDPTLTSGPLVTTIVDTSGLLIYLMIAEAIMHGP